MSETSKKPTGRPRKYESEGSGAPYLGMRLEPSIYEHVRAQPEGPRAYVERLVTDDIHKQKPNVPAQTADAKETSKT